jgi:hypothetical protein
MVDTHDDRTTATPGTDKGDPTGTPPFGGEAHNPEPSGPDGSGVDEPRELVPPAGEADGEDSAPPTFPTYREELTDELSTVRDVLDGKTKWGEILTRDANLRDALVALRICYKYHPDNDGKDSRSPRHTLGDIAEMREDLMHLSAVGVRLAALSAQFEGGAKASDNERKHARSSAWVRIDQDMRTGKLGPGKFTLKDKEHYAELAIADYYRVQSKCEIRGRILSWTRASVRDMVESFGILIRSSMREERSDARIQA